MLLYHGSPRKFKAFRQRGKPGSFAVKGRKCVWMTASRETAVRKYARTGGYVYTVDVPEGAAVPYADQRAAEGLPKKKTALTAGVYVAPAHLCRIVAVEKI